MISELRREKRDQGETVLGKFKQDRQDEQDEQNIF
jgi:hypothetical protein